jgi:peroxiredoxin Q/BCP
MIQVGEKAPAFEATIGDGSDASLYEWLGRGPVVLYFYPKDFTPG